MIMRFNSKFSLFFSLILCFISTICVSSIRGQQGNEQPVIKWIKGMDQRYEFLKGVATKRQSIQFVREILAEFDQELARAEENVFLQKRFGCTSFGGLPAGDCENKDLTMGIKARDQLKPGGRNPGRK